jgi:hypothetical protein
VGYWYHLFNQLFSKNWVSLNLSPTPYWHLTTEGISVIKELKQSEICG